MSDKCQNIINPLMVRREGTDQVQRDVSALRPSSAPVDERTAADLLVYAQKLAQYLKYYRPNDQHVPGETWEPFIANDISAKLAMVAVQNISDYQDHVNRYFTILQEGVANPPQPQRNFGNLYAAIVSLAWQIDQLHQQLPAEITLKNTIQNLIKTKLVGQFQKLIAYYKAAQPDTLMLENAIDGWLLLGAPVEAAASIFTREFSNFWITDNSLDWNTYFTNIPADNSIYRYDIGGLSKRDRVFYATNHNFFTGIFDQFLRALTRIVREANEQLHLTITDWDKHEPHMALYLAFLHLFKFAQDHANTLTERHLDLYYKEILRLQLKAPVPAQAHVNFTLAKHVQEHLVKKDALLKAGKDALGKEVFFKLNEDLVVNKTKIASLKSMYIATQQDDDIEGVATNILKNRLFASPIANSQDGLGAELTNPQQSWHPFANKAYKNGILQSIQMPTGRVGFAIASHYLYLREGTRTIFVFFETQGASPLMGFNTSDFEAAITTEKGWFPLSVLALPFFGFSLFVMTMPEDAPATIPYDSTIHGESFTTENPILKIWLRHNSSSEFLYKKLKAANLTAAGIRVDVTGVRDLHVQNDFGAVNPVKPFQPFGPTPDQSNALLIGNSEIFQKKGAVITPKIIWQPQPGTSSTRANAKLQRLNQGTWIDDSSIANENLFDGSIPAFTLTEADVTEPTYGNNPIFSVNSNRGFIRYYLNGNFGHKTYQDNQTLYLIDQANGAPNNVSKPTPPYTPVIQEISLNYSAFTTLELNTADPVKFADRSMQFFHLLPFGETEAHPYLRNAGIGEETTISLLPKFQHKNAGDSFFVIEKSDGTVPTYVEHEGEFYLGLENLEPPQVVSVLFQLDEGSANPLISKPKNHVHWSYLSDNHWISFKKEEVSDRTNQLTRSGIITFSIPRPATDDNTILPGGQFWLRAAVTEASEAVAPIISVIPQAALATFTDQGNAEDFLALPLPAGTISKLATPDAAIKKVEQPFASFGGQMREASPKFYIRVSERLRHKDRGIAIWDYEHLVLEAFPNIYKVKCLPHTRYEPSETRGIYNELSPGHVTVVTIPNLRNQNAVNPLEPYTNLGDLEQIHDFLRKRISCFAKLHVRNPIFEQVRVVCKVKFYSQYDETFFTKQLQQDITQFLSPWAFDAEAKIKFGGRVDKSTLINFIDERYYVDYVTDFKLYHRPEKSATEIEKDIIEASKAASILVSAPAELHLITPIPLAVEEAVSEQCGC